MKKDRIRLLLVLLNLAFAFIGVGQIWLVQLSSYPLWNYVGPKEFRNYHLAWWHSIWLPVFVPAALSIICTVMMLWYRLPQVPRSLVWTAIILLIVTYGTTYIWWAPLMALISATPQEFVAIFHWAPFISGFGWENKSHHQLYALLLSTHWWRVALLTGYGITLFYIALVGLNFKNN